MIQCARVEPGVQASCRQGAATPVLVPVKQGKEKMVRGTPGAGAEYMAEEHTAAGENANPPLLDLGYLGSTSTSPAAASRLRVHAEGEPVESATVSESGRGRRTRRTGRPRARRVSDGLLGKVAVIVAISLILSIAIPIIICLGGSIRHKQPPHGTSLGKASRRLSVEAGEEAPLLGDAGNPAEEHHYYLTFPQVELGSDEVPPPYLDACPPYSVVPRPGETSFLATVPKQQWQRFMRKFPFVALVGSIVLGALVGLGIVLLVAFNWTNRTWLIVSGFAMVYTAALIFASVWLWMRNPGPVVFPESDQPPEHATGEEDRGEENPSYA